MIEPGGDHEFPPAVRKTIRQGQVADYRAAADFINREAFDLVCLQHEFGIFGGEAGALVLDLVARLDAPLVTTLHTVLDRPTAAQRRVLNANIDASARVVVMAGQARDMRTDAYGAAPEGHTRLPHRNPQT